jgi:hypothetical protein
VVKRVALSPWSMSLAVMARRLGMLPAAARPDVELVQPPHYCKSFAIR